MKYGLISAMAMIFFSCMDAEFDNPYEPGSDSFVYRVLLQSLNAEPAEPAGPCNPCKVFITAGSFNGNLVVISGADEKCNTDSNKPDDAEYKAMIVAPSLRQAEPGNQMDWVFQPEMQYVRAADQVSIGTTTADAIFDLSGPGLDASFGTAADGDYWTGLEDNWVDGSLHCNSWSTDTNAYMGTYGGSSSTDNLAIRNTASDCNLLYHLVCVEQ